jgi:cysteine-rich repeat protein
MLGAMQWRTNVGLALLTGFLGGGCFSPDETVESATSDGTGSTGTGSSSNETEPTVTSGTTVTSTDPTATGGTGTTPTGATDPTDPTDPTNPGTESGSETGTPASCGDGNVDVDEDCDDGNDVNGDGCNNDCVESGVIVWESTYDRGPMEATALAVDEDGQVMVLGNSRTSEDVYYSDWRRLYASNGDIVSTGGTGGFDASRIAASGDTWLISYLDEPHNGFVPEHSHEIIGTFGIARVSALFADEWSTVLPNTREIGQLHAREGGGLLVSGGVLNALNNYQYEHDGFVAAYNNGGALDWQRLDEDDGGPRDCHPAAQLENGGSVEACIRTTDEVTVRRRHADGGPAAELALGQITQWHWTAYWANDRMFPAMAGGPSGEAALVIDNRVFKFTPSTTEDWDQALATAGDEFFFSIAIDGAGSVILGGRRQSASGSAGLDGVIIKLAPDGTEYWTHIVETDDDDEVRAVAVTSQDRVVFCATEGRGAASPSLTVGVLTP